MTEHAARLRLWADMRDEHGAIYGETVAAHLRAAADEIDRLSGRSGALPPAPISARLRDQIFHSGAVTENVALAAADEIERLRTLVRNVAQVDPRCTGDDDYAVCAFCGGGQLERDEQPEPNRVVTDHHDEWTYGGSRDAIIWSPRRTYSRLVRIEHEADCPWLACRQESPC